MTLRQKQFAVYSTVFLALLLLFFFLHVSTGFTYYSHSHLLAILLGGGTAEENTVVFDFRLVRAVLAVLIGMGLALSGAVFQQLTRNELAGPGLLGVNAGAGLGVMILIFLTPVDQGLPIWSLPIVAVVGALIAAGSIFALAMRKNEAGGTYALVLSGITLTAGIHALQTLLIVLLSPEKFNQVNTWIIGNIAGNTWAHVLILGAVVIVLALILYANRTTLNILTLRDETAIGLGVSLKRSRLSFLILAVILAATCVAIGGMDLGPNDSTGIFAATEILNCTPRGTTYCQTLNRSRLHLCITAYGVNRRVAFGNGRLGWSRYYRTGRNAGGHCGSPHRGTVFSIYFGTETGVSHGSF